MKNNIFIYLLIIIVFTIKLSKAQTEVTFYTNMGDFTVETYDTLQPITAGNFLSLVNANFYDGIIFHRVISNFMIQGGDPTGTGYGGPGYAIDDEFDPLTSNVQGALAMANSGPNTGGSQFFINLVDNSSFLDDAYPVFGMVTSNFSVVQSIGVVATDGNDKPFSDVVMDSIRVTNLDPTSIKNPIYQAININVFPNPTNGNITIDLGSKFYANKTYSVKIINTLNQVIYSSNINEQQTTLDLSSTNKNGVYFIYITDEYGNKLDVKKIILQ